MKKKRDGGHTAPATPAVPDPPVPNRAHTEMVIGDPPSRDSRRDPGSAERREDPKKRP